MTLSRKIALGLVLAAVLAVVSPLELFADYGPTTGSCQSGAGPYANCRTYSNGAQACTWSCKFIPYPANLWVPQDVVCVSVPNC